MPFLGPVILAIQAWAAMHALLFTLLVTIGSTVVMTGISMLLRKKPTMADFSHDAASRTVTVRQPTAPWTIRYGRSGKTGGVVTFIDTSGASNEYIHLVVTVAGHQVNAITDIYFNGEQVVLNGSGDCVSGTYNGLVHVEKHLGDPADATQPFPGLNTALPAKWTSNHLQRGRAKVYLRLKWNADKFPNGLPNITFDLQGALVWDPRSSTRGYSENAALCQADYMTNPTFGLGCGTQKATKITTTGGTNILKYYAYDGVSINGTVYEITAWVQNNSGVTVTVASNLGGLTDTVLAGQLKQVRFTPTGDGVGAAQLQLRTPTAGDNLNVTVWQPVIRILGQDANILTGTNATDCSGSQWSTFASSVQTLTQNQTIYIDIDSAALIAAANVCDEAVSLNGGGTEVRYAVNGAAASSVIPQEFLSALLTASAGKVVYTGGKWFIYAGAWRAPVLATFTDGDLRDSFKVQSKVSRRELANSAKGVYVSPLNNWQPADFPSYQDAASIAQDGEVIWKDLEFPWTISAATCQRLAKIEIQSIRRQLTAYPAFKLTAYQAVPPDVIAITRPRFSWVNKTFEVQSEKLVMDRDDQDCPAIGVDLVLRETDAAVYSWSSSEEKVVSAAPSPTSFPNSQLVAPVTTLTLTSGDTTSLTRIDGVRVTRILAQWTSPADQFVLSGGKISVEFRLHAGPGAWTPAGSAAGDATSFYIDGVSDGVAYDVRVFAQNAHGSMSAATEVDNHVVSGSFTNFTGNLIGPPVGKNMVANSGFEFNTAGAVVNTDLALNGAVADNWQVRSLSAYHASQLEDNTQQRTGKKNVLIRVKTGVTIPNDSVFYENRVTSYGKIPVAIGDIIRVSGWAAAASTGALPAGLHVLQRIGLLVFDATDTFIGELYAEASDVTSAAYRLLQASLTIPATMGGQIPSYVKVQVAGFVRNTGGGGIATGSTLYADFRFDDVKVVIQNTPLDLTPISTSYAILGGNPLTSTTGAGANQATVTLAAATQVQFGDVLLTYNTVNVTPLNDNTKYYIYASDPTYLGGTVTLQASTDYTQANAGVGNVVFGYITTPAFGAAATAGKGGGNGPAAGARQATL